MYLILVVLWGSHIKEYNQKSGCWLNVRDLRGAGGRLAHPHHRQQLCQLLQEREEEGANSREEVKDLDGDLFRASKEKEGENILNTMLLQS